MKFTDLNLSESILAGLRDVKFIEPTPVQKQAIPIVLEGKDLIGVAQTGTGKTGAFVIPIMERVLQTKREGVKALILSPTRELATQIDQEIFAIGYHAGITSATVIGGSDFSVQAKALKAGVDIIVATPGRLIDQHKVVSIDFSKLEFFVLDEADRMLDMGFLPDMKKIISWMPQKRQTLLFSATMPPEIQKLAGSIMTKPDSVEIERSKPSGQVEQRSYALRSNQKIPLVKGIFDQLDWESCIIFTSTKKGTDELQRLLKKEGIKAASIHGDRSQDERNKALNAFKNGQVPVIVATDVLARGIDIKGVSIIINYDVPNNSDDYVHRIGRTGRYDKSGIAITFVTKRDSRTFKEISDIKGNTINSIDVPDRFKNPDEFSWKDGFSVGKKASQAKETKDTTRQEKTPDREKKSKPAESKNKRKQQGNDNRGDSSAKKESPKPSAKADEGNDTRQKKSSKRDTRTPKNNQRNEPAATDTKPVKESATVKKTEEKKAPAIVLPVIESAVERNKRARKPAKGIWGIIKSFIPKL